MVAGHDTYVGEKIGVSIPWPEVLACKVARSILHDPARLDTLRQIFGRSEFLTPKSSAMRLENERAKSNEMQQMFSRTSQVF
jgi:hypothetical protein